MKKLLNAIANSSVVQQISLLPQALEYGELGIDFLIKCLENIELEIRATAYQLLQNVDSQKAKKAIAPGLLLNPGDKIYYLHESTMWFTDSHYVFYQFTNKDLASHLSTREDYQNRGYKVVKLDREAHIISYAPHYVNYQQAKASAISLQNKRILKDSITDFDIDENPDVVKQWCDRYKITEEVRSLQIEQNKKNGLDKWFKADEVQHIYWFTVEQYLKSIQNLDLLNQLWTELVGTIAAVSEVVFNRTTYLTIDPYYTRIFELQKRYKFYGGEDISIYDKFTPQEAETEFLLEALNDPKLETRSIAYQLLQGIESEKAQEAIDRGIKLNPGDKIYSVYQAGIYYTDQILFVLWDYVDYPEQLRCQLENIQEYLYPEHSQRIYCYTNKQEAEATAEAFHRKIIQETNISFEWRKENPNFDPKQWCLDNNFSYKSEWDSWDNYQIIWAIKDEIGMDDKLLDNFRRSRCIYHPKHIDTWCNDNSVEYDRGLDNWDNYKKVMDYLHLPENIELLSKFWKDGTGNLAFVKEEVVLQKTYIKIGKELKDRSEAKKLLAVSKENEEAANKLLLKIIEDKQANKDSKSQARKILQESDWDDIPF